MWLVVFLLGELGKKLENFVYGGVGRGSLVSVCLVVLC